MVKGGGEGPGREQGQLTPPKENVYQERLSYDKCEEWQSLNLAVRQLFQTFPTVIPIN